MRRLLQLLAALIALTPSVGLTDEKPTALRLEANKLDAETVLIRVQLSQADRNLRPVLLETTSASIQRRSLCSARRAQWNRKASSLA